MDYDWQCRTWLHFLKLRRQKDGQKEIRDLVDAISKVIEPRAYHAVNIH
jgi:thymidylate synthase ThyX